MLLAASALPEREFGGKIFTGKNLEETEWVERLGHLKELYQEIAIQMKTPLSLAFAWLKDLRQDLGRQDRQPEQDTVVEKVMKQLRNVDLAFDRLSLYDYDGKKGWFPAHMLELDFGEVLQNVKEDLPDSDWKRIADVSSRPWPILEGDLFQLTFCIETILAYLLQVIPEDDKVQMKVSSAGGLIAMDFSGVCPQIQGSRLNRALAAVAMGESIIRRFMKNRGGKYQKRREGSRKVFRLSLPAVRSQGRHGRFQGVT